MSFFNVSITGLETIEKDLNEELKEITNLSNLALSNLGVEMIETLQKFTNEIFYKGYTPKKYERRTDDTSLGTPLGDRANMDYFAKNNTLWFTYTPTGEHKNPKWNMNRTGDELIRFIQRGGFFNEYASPLPQRPYWNEFIAEEQQTIFDYYKNAMLPYSVIRDNTDVLDLSEFEE